MVQTLKKKNRSPQSADGRGNQVRCGEKNKQCECVESSLLPVCSGVASVVRDFVQQVSLLTYCLAGQTKSVAVGRFVQP